MQVLTAAERSRRSKARRLGAVQNTSRQFSIARHR